MIQKIALVFALCLLASTLGSESPTCENHPIFLKANSFLKRSVNGHENAGNVMEQFIKTFKSSTPSVLSEQQLGVCSAYSAQSTCCTEKLVGFLDKAAALSASKLLKNENPVHKLGRLIYKVLKRNTCTSSIPANILDNSQLTKLQAYKESVQVCKKQFVKAISSLNRGAMCAICTGVDKVNDYFVNGVLGVSEASATGFDNEVSSAFDCLQSALYDGEALSQVITEAITFYNSDSSDCTNNRFSSERTAIVNIFGTGSGSDSDGDNNKKCNAKVLFNERTICDAAQNGDADIDTDGDAYNPDSSPKPVDPRETPKLIRFLEVENIYRTLSETEDVQVLKSGGISAYVPSDTDNKITNEGDAQISFYGYDDGQNASSSVETLRYITLFTILSFIAL